MNLIDAEQERLRERFPEGTRLSYRGHYGDFEVVATGGYYPSLDEDLIPVRDDDYDSIAVEADETTMSGDELDRFPWCGRAFCPSISELHRL